MWTCAGVLLVAACAAAITRDQFYPHGPGLDQTLQKGKEIASPEVTLKIPIVFYGEVYESIFVNNYGLLTFRADMPNFLNSEFPLPYPSIAAFYTNVDTTDVGDIYYRETNESHILSKAEESVQNNFHEYYDFKPSSVFIATWIDVTYEGPTHDRRNSFQIAVISNGTESFVELLYPEREIQWIQRETRIESLPDAKAQAGFVSEDGRMFTLRGSGSHHVRNLISWSNTHEPGKYVFRVGNIPLDGNIAVPDDYNQYDVEIEEESKTCAQSGPSVCHMQARCVDFQAGICCQCIEGFYGNGKSCIKNDVPLRVHGKLNGVLNDITLNDIDIQSYVVVAEGRAYTALSLTPPSLGSSMQFLHVLGDVVGWMFAKPFGTAKNGYQLTGALFNHSADIWFPKTGDRVTITQEYLGHDVFDQITLETDVKGTVPVIMSNTKLLLTEYTEQYTLVEPGLIKSDSNRKFTNKITGEQYEQRISQTLSYQPCRFAPTTPQDSTPLSLLVSKIYLGYEVRENIVRYGSTNKITPLGQEDPCIEGRKTCGYHSTCVVRGDSFTCVCQTGYASVYIDETTNTCVDVDECAAGTHNCDGNADCLNSDGSFQCRCREGFEGNGITCKPISKCRNIKCSENAKCEENYGEEPFCVCNPGYSGDGQSCYQSYEYACARCSPYASCPFSEIAQKYSCRCNTGFSGDGYVCTENEPDTTPHVEITNETGSEAEYNETVVLPHCDSNGCVCPSGYSNFWDERNNELCRLDTYPEPRPTESTEPPRNVVLPRCDADGCECPPGYALYIDQRNEELCRLESSYIEQKPEPADNNDTSMGCYSDTDCPPNAVCTFSLDNAQSGHCVCPEGYEGDAYECIEKTDPYCNCGPNAHCLNSYPGDTVCVCDLGFHGDGVLCKPNSSCRNNSDCEYNAECRANPDSSELTCQCIDGYIKDQNDACIPDAQLCNGALCAEHASCLYDEAIDISYCQCNEGYEGQGISQCVPIGHTCDVANDCSPDAICSPIDNTFSCVCKDGFIGDGYTCTIEMTCRTNPELCSPHASCLKTSDGYACECNNGYSGNGTHCQLNPRKAGNFLVASDGTSVYRVPFQVSPRDYATPINSGISQIAVGIAVDCEAGKIYWGDVISNNIKRASYDGSEYEIFLSFGIISPEGIAIDWAARNIFWTDSRKLTIEVANIDTKVRKVLFAIDGISNPRGIAVHPQRGKIFWSDWKRDGPKIEWANMDGTERGVFLDKTDVKLPNSLAIDWVKERLCFADAMTGIKCVGIDSLHKELIAQNTAYPFGLAVNGDTFYWSDWKTLSIENINTETQRRDKMRIASSSTRLYGVAVALEQCPSAYNVCMYRNGGCGPDQLCLPNGQGSRTCVDGDKNYEV